MTEQIILMMIRLVVGALATLFAIILWAKSRDSAWLLVIIGVILSYGSLLFQALELFGLVVLEISNPVARIAALGAMENLPLFFISLGIIVKIARRP